MQYVNFVYEESDNPVLHNGPVAESDAMYLRAASEHLTALSDEQYMTGPAAILQTLAKYSYVLDGNQLYWCIEWEPGLLIIWMAPNAELKWVALRDPLPEDEAPDKNDDDNPQYNLIFTPWDAQFDVDYRKWRSFTPADDDIQNRFQNALARVNSLGEIMERRFSDDSETWFKNSKLNLQQWCGEGLPLKPTR